MALWCGNNIKKKHLFHYEYSVCTYTVYIILNFTTFCINLINIMSRPLMYYEIPVIYIIFATANILYKNDISFYIIQAVKLIFAKLFYLYVVLKTQLQA